jgi:hypothetical protein
MALCSPWMADGLADEERGNAHCRKQCALLTEEVIQVTAESAPELSLIENNPSISPVSRVV